MVSRPVAFSFSAPFSQLFHPSSGHYCEYPILNMPDKRVRFDLKSWLGFAFLFFTLQTCSDPFAFNIQAEEQKLVVDGFITNQFKQHLVRLSFTTSRIEDIPILNPVVVAQVELHNDQGAVIQLEGDRRGNFFTPPFRAEEGRAYQLVVRVGSESYRSSMESLPEANRTPDLQLAVDDRDYRDIIQGSLVINRQGLSIAARIDKDVISNGRQVYYQWFVSDCRLTNLPDNPQGRLCQVFGDIQRESRLHLHEDKFIPGQENESYFNELIWFPKPNSANIGDFLVIEIDQMIISEKAHEYWSGVEELIESSGTIFDPTPFRILGNVVQESTGNPTLGFFGVYREAGNWERLTPVGF